MNKFLVLALSTALFYSCGDTVSPVKENADAFVGTTSLFVKPTGYSFIDTSRLLYIERRDTPVIQLECLTNFPKGTVIIIDKSEDFESVTRMTYQELDTIQVDRETFSTLITPSMSSGYIVFRIKEELQPSDVLAKLKAHVNQEPIEDYKCEALFCSFYRFKQDIKGVVADSAAFLIRFPQ